MKTLEVIHHLEELWATATDRDKRDALHIAVAILQRMEKRPAYQENHGKHQIVTPNFPPLSLEDEAS